MNFHVRESILIGLLIMVAQPLDAVVRQKMYRNHWETWTTVDTKTIVT